MIGRPLEYTIEIGDAICERLADGESLRSICRDDNMPARSTVFRWLGLFDEFQDQYARAREAQAEALADEIINIADEAEGDFVERENKSGEVVQAFDREHVQRSALRVSARQWVAARLLPKKYGDRLTQEHTGPNGAPVGPVGPVINVYGRPGPASASAPVDGVRDDGD